MRDTFYSIYTITCGPIKNGPRAAVGPAGRSLDTPDLEEIQVVYFNVDFKNIFISSMLKTTFPVEAVCKKWISRDRKMALKESW